MKPFPYLDQVSKQRATFLKFFRDGAALWNDAPDIPNGPIQVAYREQPQRVANERIHNTHDNVTFEESVSIGQQFAEN